MAELVLLIDDDVLPMQYYIKALRLKGFNVKQCLDPDSALDFVKKRGAEITAILLDIMMPPGKVYEPEDTDEGLKTGIFLYKDLRKYYPQLPIVVLTNVKNPITLGEFQLGTPPKVLQKMEWPPHEVADFVRQMISSLKNTPYSGEVQP